MPKYGRTFYVVDMQLAKLDFALSLARMLPLHIQLARACNCKLGQLGSGARAFRWRTNRVGLRCTANWTLPHERLREHARGVREASKLLCTADHEKRAI